MQNHYIQGTFITGTGTNVGKTIVTAALTRALWTLHETDFQGYVPVKPVQTGSTSHTKAIDNPNQIMGDASIYAQALSQFAIPKVFQPKTLHHFALPASPHLAASHEHISLSVQDLHAEILDLGARVNYNPIIIEGAGGIYVPLNSKETMLNLMQSLGLPIILVMQNGLGAINHTLLSLETLQTHGLNVAAIVCTEVDNQHTLIKQDNIAFLIQYAPHIPIYALQYMEELNQSDPQIWSKAWHNTANSLAPLAKQLVDVWKKSPEQTKASQLLDWDKTHLWHPYTSSTKPLPVYEATHAKGMNIFLRDKKEPLIDGMSSWWCAAHGYGNAELIQAAKNQAERMPHIMFGGLTHEPAIRAAQKLLHLLPKFNKDTKNLERVFWADSGSVAVEVALKMALQYQQGRGQKQRTIFLSPRGGYYGDTMGAMSVCDPINGMHTLFNHVLAQHIFIPRPSCPFNQTDNTPFDEHHLLELEQAFDQHGSNIAAFIVEPIVQGAGGMWFYDPRYLQRANELCKHYDVLLVFDEIATGFGRTGKMFAAQWANITPDICCVGKALSGGFVNLAATICTEDVAMGICANNQVFMHGPTYMANALACAVAEASLNIFARDTWKEQVTRIEHELRQGLNPCNHFHEVQDVRVLGAIGVVEMRENVNVAALQAFFVQQGVWIRPFGKLIYIMPPYIAQTGHINTLTKAIALAIELGIYKMGA